MSWTIWCLCGAWLIFIGLILLWLVMPRLRGAMPADGLAEFKQVIDVTLLHGLSLMVLGILTARAELLGIKLACLAILAGCLCYIVGGLLHIRIKHWIPKVIDGLGVILILAGWSCALLTLLVL